MSPDETYDPEADLIALRTDGRAKLGVYALFAAAVFLLGTYLQSLSLRERLAANGIDDPYA